MGGGGAGENEERRERRAARSGARARAFSHPLSIRSPQADPISLSSLPPHAPELTRVTATGTLAHDRSALIGPRPRSAPGGTTINGFLLVTPLLEGGGGRGARVVALIARGWVPAAWKEGAAAAQPAGRVTLPTVLRTAEAPSRFVPPNRPGAGEWHWLDPDALAAAAGADGPVPLLEALAPDDDAPTQSQGKGPPPPMDVLGGRTGSRSGGGGGTAAAPPPSYPAPRRLADLTAVAVTPADHRNYAVTWGTLAAATAGLAVRAGRRR